VGKQKYGPVAQPESNLGSVGMVGFRPWNFNGVRKQRGAPSPTFLTPKPEDHRSLCDFCLNGLSLNLWGPLRDQYTNGAVAGRSKMGGPRAPAEASYGRPHQSNRVLGRCRVEPNGHFREDRLHPGHSQGEVLAVRYQLATEIARGKARRAPKPAQGLVT